MSLILMMIQKLKALLHINASIKYYDINLAQRKYLQKNSKIRK